MAVYGRGALAGWFDYSGPESMDEWQAREHMAERMTAPGFVRGRRFKGATARPRHFMFYETTTIDALASPAYLEALNNPSDWSRRCSSGLRDMRRSACVITASTGTTDGGTVATMELVAADPARLRSELAETLLPQVCERTGVYSAHLLETDSGTSSISTTEKELRTVPDVIVNWAVVVEGLDPHLVGEAVADVLSPDRLRASGAERTASPHLYQLSFAVNSALAFAH